MLKQYGTDENVDVIINIDKGDLKSGETEKL